MLDRQPTIPGRIKLTDESGNSQYYIMERADEPTTIGTPINKNTLFNNNNSNRFACDLPSKAFELMTTEWQVLVPASGWSSNVDDDGYYTNTISVSGMKEVFQPTFIPLYDVADNVSAIDGAFSVIKRMITSDGSVTFLATEVPPIDITIRVWRV